MNGESVFGWLKVGGVAIIAVALGVIAWLIYRYIKDAGGIGAATMQGANVLKNDTPLGIPARAIDSGISAATGREETLGGWLAELFNPSTRAFNASMQTNTSGKGQRAEVTMARNSSYVDWQ